MHTTQIEPPYALLNEQLAKGEQDEKRDKKPAIPMYTFRFKAPSGRWFTVVACDLTIQELLIPCKQNRFQPLLKGLQSIVPQPLPPCLAAKHEKPAATYPEAA